MKEKITGYAIGLSIALLLMPVLFIVSVAGALWASWWLHPAWSWFIVPLGAPAISLWHFAALFTLVRFLTTHVSPKKDERTGDPWGYTATVILSPIFTWAMLSWMR